MHSVHDTHSVNGKQFSPPPSSPFTFPPKLFGLCDSPRLSQFLVLIVLEVQATLVIYLVQQDPQTYYLIYLISYEHKSLSPFAFWQRLVGLHPYRNEKSERGFYVHLQCISIYDHFQLGFKISRMKGHHNSHIIVRWGFSLGVQLRLFTPSWHSPFHLFAAAV